MKVWQQYLEEEIRALRQIESTQQEAIESAARILADCTKKEGIIRVFGCGHSHLIADDVFYRSATLGNVQARTQRCSNLHFQLRQQRGYVGIRKDLSGTGFSCHCFDEYRILGNLKTAAFQRQASDGFR